MGMPVSSGFRTSKRLIMPDSGAEVGKNKAQKTAQS